MNLNDPFAGAAGEDQLGPEEWAELRLLSDALDPFEVRAVQTFEDAGLEPEVLDIRREAL